MFTCLSSELDAITEIRIYFRVEFTSSLIPSIVKLSIRALETPCLNKSIKKDKHISVLPSKHSMIASREHWSYLVINLKAGFGSL